VHVARACGRVSTLLPLSRGPMGTHADPMGTPGGAQGATGGRWGSTGPHGEPTGTPLGPKVGYGTSQSYTGPDHANRPRCGAHPMGTLCHIIEIFFRSFSSIASRVSAVTRATKPSEMARSRFEMARSANLARGEDLTDLIPKWEEWAAAVGPIDATWSTCDQKGKKHYKSRGAPDKVPSSKYNYLCRSLGKFSSCVSCHLHVIFLKTNCYPLN